MRIRNKTKGITLIALVITIIILLILVGVSIAMLTGENGILTQATKAREETRYSTAEEKVKLAVMASYDESGKLDKDKLKENINKIEGLDTPIEGEIEFVLSIYVDGYLFTITDLGVVTGSRNSLPEDTPENSQEIGKEVVLKEGWGIETVYAISVGNGEIIPVPKGFYYVGGTLDTGVVISDNEADKYDGKTDKTAWEYTTQLKGNQFVWIPCQESEYKKSSTWNGTTQYFTSTTNYKLANSNWDTTTYASELPQIQKYGGFYVGRYEAGLASTISEFTTEQKHDGVNQVYNKEGVPQSKAGQIPWNFIDWTKSKSNAESMYNNDYVYSGLITGTQWDVMLNKMVEKCDDLEAADLTSSGDWGNYRDNQIDYKGRLSKIYYSSGWYMPVFGSETTGKTGKYESDNTNGDLLTTGASKTTGKYNIYDVAGNLWEWTEEASYYGGNVATQYRVYRGGGCAGAYATYPACYRAGLCTVGHADPHLGFRAALYIK